MRVCVANGFTDIWILWPYSMLIHKLLGTHLAKADAIAVCFDNQLNSFPFLNFFQNRETASLPGGLLLYNLFREAHLLIEERLYIKPHNYFLCSLSSSSKYENTYAI
jgi:hypothetical protein